MKPIAVSLALVLAVTAAAAAQEAGKAKPTTEVVWEAKIRGVGGWSAAAMANKARAALSQVKGVESVLVDTTARAVIRMKEDAQPSEKTLNAAIEKMGMKVKKLKKVNLPIANAVYKIRVEGVRWQDSCRNIRGIFEKMSDVIAAYAYGDKGTVEVFTKKTDTLTEKAAKKAISTKKNFKLVAFEKKVLGQAKSDWPGSTS